MTLQEEIQNGESRTLEYKATLPHDSQKWIKTIVSFANDAGGKFVLGVNNQREFVGLAKSVDLFELKDNIADTIGQMCEPQIMFDITADIVEISSPGSIYGSLTLEETLEGRSSIRNKTLVRTLEKIDVLENWGSGFKRIFAECDEYGVDRPEFLEIGDMLRVNFYRSSYKQNGDKSGKSAINYKDKILDYLSKHSEASFLDIALFIGLKQSRTKDYLSELVEAGKIVAIGANRNRTYSLK